MIFKSSIRFAVLLGFCLSLAAQAASDELRLRRVMLSSSGVGYFEYEAEVTGNTMLRLTVGLDQVDDVLKSMVVYDDKGGIGGVSLPGRDPLSQVFKKLPFDAAALASPALLMDALRGAEVRVNGRKKLVGRIVSVNEINAGDGQRHRVTLMTDAGLQQFVLQDEQTQSLTFTDPVLNNQVKSALASMASNRARDARTFELTSKGTGKRTVRVAYIIGVPLWKVSYRLTLDRSMDKKASNQAAMAQLQGWAALENVSGQDWKDVELTLVSGRPVAFTQALYQSYYASRSNVPVEIMGQIMPGLDIGASKLTMGELNVPVPASMAMRAVPMAPRAAAPAPAPAIAAPSGMGFGQTGLASGKATQANTANYELSQAASAITQDQDTQISYTFPLPVTVGNGRSLSVPVIQTNLPAKRFGLYQPPTHASNPLATVELKNTSTSSLPPGVVTIYERSTANAGASGNNQTTNVAFVGDARLAAFPAGEERMLSYALDQKTSISSAQNVADRLSGYRIEGETLIVKRVDVYPRSYTLKPLGVVDSAEVRNFVLEVPNPFGSAGQVAGVGVANERGGIDLIAFKAPDTLESIVRVPASTKGTLATKMTVDFVRDGEQRYSLVNNSHFHNVISILNEAERLSNVAAVKSFFDEKTKQFFQRWRELHNAANAASEAMNENKRTEQSTIQNQARLRENIRGLPTGNAVIDRYMKNLGEDEDKLDALKKDWPRLQAANSAARDAIRAHVSTYVK